MKKDEITIEQAREGLIRIFRLFSKADSDSMRIINQAHNLTFNELLRLIESSLSVQKETIESMTKRIKRLQRQAEELAQGQLF